MPPNTAEEKYSNSELLYLDYQASTPLDPAVREAMLPLLAEFGNPHSTGHPYGRQAAALIERARAQVADLVGANPEDVIFTSGATEANNLALRGLAQAYDSRPARLISLATEHASVLEPIEALAREGVDVCILPVQPDGLVDLARLERELAQAPAIVSIAAANNEIGVLQPLEMIANLCLRHGALLHSDATQAVGKVPLGLYECGIDALSLSGHKTYGPMGIGALVATARIRNRLVAQSLGGGQQAGLRSGTLPTFLCVGLGEACRLAHTQLAEEAQRLRSLRDRLLSALSARVQGLRLNGPLEPRIPGNLNLCVPDIDTLQLMTAVPELAFSSGSACASSGGHLAPSHVLRALGLSIEEIRGSFRLGFGRFTREADIDRAADRLAAAISMLRTREDGAE